MNQHKLYLFGSPALEVAGEPVAIDTRKALALVAYLAVTGQPHTRDGLAALFWPEADATRARAALRRTLSTLRTALDNRWLVTDREQVHLQKQSDLWIDVDQFHAQLAACTTHNHPPGQVCPLCLAPLAQAVECYRGDFMAGFSLAGSAEFDDWQFFQSESLRREYIEALQRLVAGHSHQRAFDPAIVYARRWLQADPLDEAAHRHLMHLYAQTGQRTAALRQYQECVRLLAAELGVPPTAETTALHTAIQTHSIPSSAAPVAPRIATVAPASASVDAPPAFQLPLVGRLAEWSALERHYAAGRKEGRFILLQGEAGIGKTRLAEEFLDHVQQGGGRTLIMRCYAGEANLAYGPFIEGLRTAALDETALARLRNLPPHLLTEITRLLPELRQTFAHLPELHPLDSPGVQSHFFQGLNDVVAALLTGAPPGLLFIDDLHWADEPSLDLVIYLMRRLPRHAYTILVTWRSAEETRDQHLRPLLAALQRSSLGLHLTLERLRQQDVTALAENMAAVGRSVSVQAVDTLYHETEGLPFLVAEYLTAIAHGMESAAVEHVLGERMRALFQNRLGNLPQTVRHLLMTAATIGRAFDFETLRRASEQDERATVDGLESLLARGILREKDGGLGYDFSHEKLRALVYQEISAARRRLLHRRVAAALSAQSTAAAAQIAHHFYLADAKEQAAHYYRAAGEQARRLYANAEALSHFRTALELGHPAAAALHEAIGELATLRGEYLAALRSYQRAVAEQTHDAPAAARLAYKQGDLHHRLGEWEQAETHYRAGLERLNDGEDEAGRALLYSAWSLTVLQGNHPARALDLAQRSLELARAVNDERTLAQVHNTLGLIARHTGDLAAARTHLEASSRYAARLDHLATQVAALNNLALLYAGEQETARALDLIETALIHCRTLGDRHREAALLNNLADLLHQAGRTDEAMNYLKQAVAIFAEVGAELDDYQLPIWRLAEW